MCLCRYSVKQLKFSDLDISSLALLVKVSGSLESFEEDWISQLLQQRNKICHLPRISALPISNLEKIWKETADHILKIAGLIPMSYFRNSIEREITNLKARTFYPVQAADCMRKHLRQCDNETQTDDELNVEPEKKTAETDSPEFMVENYGKVFALIQFDRKSTPIEPGILKKNTNDNIEMSENQEQLIGLRCRCTVEGEATNAYEEIIYQRLQQSSNRKKADSDPDLFQILNAEKHCIILELKLQQHILQDSQKLHSAIRSLLQTIITAGDIDQNVPTLMIFRFDNFVDISYEKYNKLNAVVTENPLEPTLNRANEQVTNKMPKRRDTELKDTALFKLLHQENETIVGCQPILGHLMQIIFDLFPDIVRNWLMTYYSLDELIKEISREESPPSTISDPLAEYSLDKLYEISKKLNKINKPENGWETYPKDENITPSDDVVRMIFLTKRVKCRLSSTITVPERNQFIDRARNLASRFDIFFKKQQTFENRLRHLSNEWEFLEYVHDGLKKFELPYFHQRTPVLELAQSFGGARATQGSTWSIDSGISDDQSNYQGQKAGRMSHRSSISSVGSILSPKGSASKDERSLHDEDGHLSAKQSTKLPKIKVGEPLTCQKIKPGKLGGSLSSIAEKTITGLPRDHEAQDQTYDDET